jgi:hypothetical protein
MDKYYKRCRIITDLFLKTYEEYIICLSEEDDDKFEIILHTGDVIIINDDTSWKHITEFMKDKII